MKKEEEGHTDRGWGRWGPINGNCRGEELRDWAKSRGLIPLHTISEKATYDTHNAKHCGGVLIDYHFVSYLWRKDICICLASG